MESVFKSEQVNIQPLFKKKEEKIFQQIDTNNKKKNVENLHKEKINQTLHEIQKSLQPNLQNKNEKFCIEDGITLVKKNVQLEFQQQIDLYRKRFFSVLELMTQNYEQSQLSKNQTIIQKFQLEVEKKVNTSRVKHFGQIYFPQEIRAHSRFETIFIKKVSQLPTSIRDSSNSFLSSFNDLWWGRQQLIDDYIQLSINCFHKYVTKLARLANIWYLKLNEFYQRKQQTQSHFDSAQWTLFVNEVKQHMEAILQKQNEKIFSLKNEQRSKYLKQIRDMTRLVILLDVTVSTPSSILNILTKINPQILGSKIIEKQKKWIHTINKEKVHLQTFKKIEHQTQQTQIQLINSHRIALHQLKTHTNITKLQNSYSQLFSEHLMKFVKLETDLKHPTYFSYQKIVSNILFSMEQRYYWFIDTHEDIQNRLLLFLQSK